MFGMFSILGILVWLLMVVVVIAVAWVVIFTAVRAALASHREALRREGGLPPAGGV